MERLQLAAIQQPETDKELVDLAQAPRPWDPGTCRADMRGELWDWLDQVATWVNEQHLWNITRPGVPECWPSHPHLVHDLALLACSRYYTSYQWTPAALENWHTYALPGFLERVRDRLGDACQPGKHQPRPRDERDNSHRSATAHRTRRQRYASDQAAAARDDAARFDTSVGGDVPDEIHGRW